MRKRQRADTEDPQKEEGAEGPEGIWAEESSSSPVKGENAELQEKASDSRRSRGCGGGSPGWPGLAQAMTS